MEEYTKKIPIFNDYETKKDLLKFMCLKENDDDNNNNNLKKNNDDVKFISNYENQNEKSLLI